MKKRIFCLIAVVGFLFVGINVFAADGDLIVNGNVGIGTTTPGAKLDVQGGSVKVGGMFLTHVTGTNSTCPAGTGVIVMRKWAGGACTDPNMTWCCTCTYASGWSVTPTNCQCSCSSEYGPLTYTCSSSNWTEAVCMGN
jgi:hypothetical protein